MKNHNRYPLAVGLSLALAAGACGMSGDPIPDSSTVPAPSVRLAKGPDARCTGRIAGFKETGFSKDGKVYTITRIGKAACASLYDPADLRTILTMYPGNELIGPCLFGGDKPARLNALVQGETADAVGDVNLDDAGLHAALSIGMCEPADRQDVAFVYPHATSGAGVVPTTPVLRPSMR